MFMQVYSQVYRQCVSRRNKPRSVGRFPSHYAGRYVSRSPLSPHFYIQKTYSPNKNKKHLRLVPIPTFPLLYNTEYVSFRYSCPETASHMPCHICLFVCLCVCATLPVLCLPCRCLALLLFAGSGPQGGG